MPWVFQEDPKTFNRYLQGNKSAGQWIALLGDLIDDEIDNVELCLILGYEEYTQYYRMLLALRDTYMRQRSVSVTELNRSFHVSDSQEVSRQIAPKIEHNDEPGVASGG